MQRRMTIRNRRRNAKKRGFTLVEICVAVLVVGLGMSSLLAVFAAAIRQAQTFRTDVTASMTARSLAEYIEAGGTITTSLNPTDAINQFGPLYIGYIGSPSFVPSFTATAGTLTFLNVKLYSNTSAPLDGEFGFWVYRP